MPQFLLTTQKDSDQKTSFKERLQSLISKSKELRALVGYFYFSGIGPLHDAIKENPCTQLIAALGKIHKETPELSYGSYRELCLTTGQFAFARDSVIVSVNNMDASAYFDVEAENGTYRGALNGKTVEVNDDRLRFTLEGNGGEIWLKDGRHFEPVTKKIEENIETIIKIE